MNENFLHKSSRNNELIIYGKRLDKKGKVMVLTVARIQVIVIACA